MKYSKKFFGLSLCLILLLLTACGAPASSSIRVPQSEAELQVESKAPLVQLRAATDAGYYELASNWAEGYSNAVFADYATLEQAVVCAAPNCDHNTDSCSGVWPLGGELLSDGNRLFYFDTQPTGGAPKVSLSEPDGSNRKVLYSAAENEALGMMTSPPDMKTEHFLALSDGQAVLFFTTSLSDGSHALRRVPYDGSAPGTIYTEPCATTAPVGVWENSIVLLRTEMPEAAAVSELGTAEYTLFLLDVETGETREFTTWSWDAQTMARRCGLISDGVYYYLLAGGDAQSGSLFAMPLDTGSAQLITSHCPTAPIETTWSSFGNEVLEQVVEGKLILSVPADHEVKSIDEMSVRRFSVDLADGTVEEITLANVESGALMPIAVYAQQGDDLLVVADIRRVNVMQSNLDGIPESYDIEKNILGLLSKQSFLQSQPDYREFTPVS